MSNTQYFLALLKAETFHEGLGVLAPDLQVPTLGSLGPTSMLADSVCGHTGLKTEVRVKVKAQAGGQPGTSWAPTLGERHLASPSISILIHEMGILF